MHDVLPAEISSNFYTLHLHIYNIFQITQTG